MLRRREALGFFVWFVVLLFADVVNLKQKKNEAGVTGQDDYVFWVKKKKFTKEEHKTLTATEQPVESLFLRPLKKM